MKTQRRTGSKTSLPKLHESKAQKFDSLMQFRVRHILLVSSSYDSYVLEEDGQLTDLIYNEYLELNLTVTPQLRRASNAAQALEVVRKQDIDLVIVFKRVSEIDVPAFGRKVKQLKPETPVILLAYDERELTSMPAEARHGAIDQVFIWTGDVKILLAIIKLIEDSLNVKRDTKLVGVRVIILVEDSVRFYSSYLPLLYTEIMQQTRSLMADGLNLSDKILRMRARPKILLATSYEEGWNLFEKNRKYLLALISDFRFTREGQDDAEAGLKLVERIKKEMPDLPVLMQSSDENNSAVAYSREVGFLYKLSPTLHNDLIHFIMTHFGFGDFVFKTPKGTLLATAGDFRSMEKCLEEVSDESLLYHAARNHFSNWLMARTEFDLASKLRPRKASEFEDAAALRKYLIGTFKTFRHEKQKGVITDFSRKKFDLQSDFVRIGGGSLGGKGRGLAFINSLLGKHNLYGRFDGVRIAVPLSAIVGTSVFDEFMETNELYPYALSHRSDASIAKKFLKAKLPRNVSADLRAILEVARFPLAVRSSSMLEDSHIQPFAGVYDTHMLVNSDLSNQIRLTQLEAAIKMVYACTFFENARAYHRAAGNRVEEEKMAVIIQQAIGQRHGNNYYPSFSGLAHSYDYYSIEGTRPEDGVVYLALGLGKTIVEGMNCLRFSPGEPQKLIQFSTVDDMLKNSQREFFAIDMSDSTIMPEPGGNKGLIKLDLATAEADGTLDPICSTYSHEEHRVMDGSFAHGAKLVTFSPILKAATFPLVDILQYLLQLGAQGLNCPIEMEYAVNLGTEANEPGRFYFLQIRPMGKEALFETVSIDDVDKSRLVIHSQRALGNMRESGITDIVYVAPESFDRSKTVEIARQVGELNDQCAEAGRKYLLIGPGRWGTLERWLGIPVTWSQISSARVIIEAAYGDFAPDPSFGTHFFHNLTGFQMGYLTVNENIGNGFVDWDWLKAQPVVKQTEYVKHVVLDCPLEILIDGRTGTGALLRDCKPTAADL